MARLLGFKSGTVIENGKSMASEFAATPSGGLHQMHVYTDCIHPQPHPDGNVDILQMIAIYKDPNEIYVAKQFQKIFYYPLKTHTTISVEGNQSFYRSFGTQTKDSFVSNKGSFVFKHLCNYYIVLDTQRSDVRKLCQQTRFSIVF